MFVYWDSKSLFGVLWLILQTSGIINFVKLARLLELPMVNGTRYGEQKDRNKGGNVGG
jgi:hypothetical protein